MSRRAARATATAALVLMLAAAAYGQGRTDVVSLANGDRITGEVVRLDRGRLEFKTNDAGTLYLEWDKLVSVVAARQIEAVTADGRRFFGTLGTGARPFHHRPVARVGCDAANAGSDDHQDRRRELLETARRFDRPWIQLHPLERRRAAQFQLQHGFAETGLPGSAHRVDDGDPDRRRRGARRPGID